METLDDSDDLYETKKVSQAKQPAGKRCLTFISYTDIF